jgi:exodeoxyribonuclease VIII
MSIETGWSMERYRAHPGVSASDLKNMQRSPAYARLGHSTMTPAKAWGTAVHCAILEPDELNARYTIDPPSPKGGYPAGWRNSTVYKEQAEKLRSTGRELLTESDFLALEAIRHRAAHHEVGKIIHELPGINEASVIVSDADTGLVRKCRPDRLISKSSMVVDVKSAIDHRPRGFARACHQYGYHLTAAYYMDTCEVDHYVFLVVNSEAPWEVAAYTLDHDSIEQGRLEYRKALAQWAGCCERGEWPAGSDKIEELRLPEYAIDYYTEEMI